MKYWEIIADRLSKAGWSLGCISAIDSSGRTIWIAGGGWVRRFGRNNPTRATPVNFSVYTAARNARLRERELTVEVPLLTLI